MFLLSMCACLWKLRSRSPLLIGGGYAYKPLGQEPAYVQTVSKGVITMIIIMYPLMRCFSRSECIAHYEAKNKAQSKQTSESMQMCAHTQAHTHTHTCTRHSHTYARTNACRVSMIALKNEYKMWQCLCVMILVGMNAHSIPKAWWGDGKPSPLHSTLFLFWPRAQQILRT